MRAITATTTTAATATWAAVSGATGCSVRVNGGTIVDAGNVLTYQATGLPSGAAGTIEIRAYNTGGNPAWASVGFTTAVLAANVIKLTSNSTTVAETGNATDGYTYAFAATPYNKGAYSPMKIPNTDGYFEYTLHYMSSHLNGGFNVNFLTGAATSYTMAKGTIGIMAPVLNGTDKYTPLASPAANPSTVVATAGDRIRIDRTGFTLYTKYSRDAGATWSDSYSKQGYAADGVTLEAPVLHISVSGNEFTAGASNFRAQGFGA